MGLAALRAQVDGCGAIELAVVSDAIASLSKTGLAGPYADIRLWQGMGGERSPSPLARCRVTLTFPQRAISAAPTRRIRSILFADYKGFSAWVSASCPFMDLVMGRIAEVLNSHATMWNSATPGAMPSMPSSTAATAAESRVDLQGGWPIFRANCARRRCRRHAHRCPLRPDLGRHRQDHRQPLLVWQRGQPHRPDRAGHPGRRGLLHRQLRRRVAGGQLRDCRFTSVGKVQLAKAFGEVELYRLEKS